ncbi:hypothetical protein [Aeromonas finlandensis]|uniref:hypothetical protein n=1 Tax=Aeromonas finlandensis TaxID=1543375 RepID=UPI00051C4623|nr:hypothetical protein [Aeromonas finlandensis]
MNIKSGILSVSLLCLPSFAMASDNDLSLLIHGASIHSGCEKGTGKKSKTCDFNGVNPGLGMAWVFLGDNDTGKLALRGGFYKDSYEKTAGYAGFSYRKEWYFTEHAFAGLGVQAGYLNGSGTDGFAALPMATIGYKSLALEIGYAPKVNWVVGREHVAVTTFSLRWTFM